jgi:hypothetical protein
LFSLITFSDKEKLQRKEKIISLAWTKSLQIGFPIPLLCVLLSFRLPYQPCNHASLLSATGKGWAIISLLKGLCHEIDAFLADYEIKALLFVCALMVFTTVQGGA